MYYPRKNELNTENSDKFSAQPCEKISSPHNGRMNCSGLVTTATCSFSCDPGYDLLGSHSRTCLPSSTWSGNLTLCKGSCYDVFPVRIAYLFLLTNGEARSSPFYHPAN